VGPSASAKRHHEATGDLAFDIRNECAPGRVRSESLDPLGNCCEWNLKHLRGDRALVDDRDQRSDILWAKLPNNDVLATWHDSPAF
jgi:hypothetical protein